MDSKKCSKIYDKLYSNLRIIFNSKEILMQLSDENFKDLILNQVSILNFLEKEIPASYLLKNKNKDNNSEINLTAQDFLDKLNTILSSNKTFLNLNFKSESEIEDEINYLTVYIKNTFKKDLSEFKKTTVNPTETAKAEFAQNYSNAPRNNFGFMGGPSFSYGGDGRNFQDQFYVQMAQQRLQQDIAKGVFYIYKSKPKIIPILKRILGFSAILYGIFTILVLILSSISSGSLFVSRSFLIGLGYKQFPNDNSEYVFSSVQNSVFMYSIFMEIFVVLIAFYFAYQMIYAAHKNENVKYSFGWGYIIFFVLYIIFFISNIATSFPQSYTYISYFYGEGYSLNSNNVTLIDCYAAAVYIQTAAYSLLGIMLIIAAIAAGISPKRDLERIDLKIQEYISEMKSSTPMSV